VPIAVVGAGPAGLAAAIRLQQRGFAVRVFEATDRVGCKLRSSRRDGFLLDEGAYFLPTTHRALLALAEETGFADQIVPGGFVLATARDGAVHQIRGDHVLGDVARIGAAVRPRQAEAGQARA
jgi:protoporphyrinogen/coproporphyrinogen III oxidase